MSGAQVTFAVALGTIALLVVVVGTYVVSSTGWARRWYRRGRRSA